MTDDTIRAVKTDEPAGFFEQDELIWRAEWRKATTDAWERGGYYATESDAIEGAIRGRVAMLMFAKLADDSE